MAVNYVLKNPVHHGQTNTPYSYKYSSANYLFAGERGIPTPRLMAHHTNHMRFIGPYFPKNAKVPDSVTVDEDGMASRLSFEELRLDCRLLCHWLKITMYRWLLPPDVQ